MRYTFSTDVIRRCLRHGDLTRAEKLIDKVHFSLLAPLVGDLTPLEARALCGLLFAPARVTRTLEELPRPELGKLLQHLEDDRLASLMAELSGPQGARVLALVSPERRRTLRKLQQAQAEAFAEQVRPVSSLMATGVPSLEGNLTVAEALAQLGSPLPEQVYVLNPQQALEGVVSRQALEGAKPEQTLAALVTPANGLMARAFTPLHVAIKQMQQLRLKVLPVLDSQGRLLGELRWGQTSPDAPGEASSTGHARTVAGWRKLFSWAAVTPLMMSLSTVARYWMKGS